MRWKTNKCWNERGCKEFSSWEFIRCGLPSCPFPCQRLYIVSLCWICSQTFFFSERDYPCGKELIELRCKATLYLEGCFAIMVEFFLQSTFPCVTMSGWSYCLFVFYSHVETRFLWRKIRTRTTRPGIFFVFTF